MNIRKQIICAAAIALSFASGCDRQLGEKHLHRADSLNYQQFQAGVEKAMSGLDGAAVAVDPADGRVLAVVNPQYAVYSAFPVGSAFKPLAVISAVEDGTAQTSRVSLCGGRTTIGAAPYKCWLAGGHGRTDMIDALARSCNIYFYSLGERMKGAAVARRARLFGFGSRPGYAPKEKAALEAAGSVPGLFPPGAASRLAAGDTSELTASPMQMAVFTAAIANGGKVFAPSSAGPGKLIRTNKADNGIHAAVEGMTRCVTDPEGTCKALFNLGYDSAGKTGTAKHVGSARTHAWFIGFSPVEEPRIAVAVFLQTGRGETGAAPAAYDIFKSFYDSQK